MYSTKALPQSDLIGAVTSGLCVIHCVATPFLFVAQAATVLGWWSFLDIFFIAITFLAVFTSARNTSKPWMPTALYASWTVLTLLVINEQLGLLPVAEGWKYGVAMVLIGLHLYNRKYCQCAEEPGCVA